MGSRLHLWGALAGCLKRKRARRMAMSSALVPADQTGEPGLRALCMQAQLLAVVDSPVNFRRRALAAVDSWDTCKQTASVSAPHIGWRCTAPDQDRSSQ